MTVSWQTLEARLSVTKQYVTSSAPPPPMAGFTTTNERNGGHAVKQINV
ncbi:MAG TPA: hypothetical protein VFA99_10465 [Acidobacteriaceae bacterium]|nr:hypothetical protein [Acidobacteriaceae bacterium]